jgi:hypothetical protein
MQFQGATPAEAGKWQREVRQHLAATLLGGGMPPCPDLDAKVALVAKQDGVDNAAAFKWRFLAGGMYGRCPRAAASIEAGDARRVLPPARPLMEKFIWGIQIAACPSRSVCYRLFYGREV